MIEVLKNPFKSIIVADENGQELRIDEGNTIAFVNENGEVITGELIKIVGKKNIALTIQPPDTQRQEIWYLNDVREIKVVDQ